MSNIVKFKEKTQRLHSDYQRQLNKFVYVLSGDTANADNELRAMVAAMLFLQVQSHISILKTWQDKVDDMDGDELAHCALVLDVFKHDLKLITTMLYRFELLVAHLEQKELSKNVRHVCQLFDIATVQLMARLYMAGTLSSPIDQSQRLLATVCNLRKMTTLYADFSGCKRGKYASVDPRTYTTAASAMEMRHILN